VVELYSGYPRGTPLAVDRTSTRAKTADDEPTGKPVAASAAGQGYSEREVSFLSVATYQTPRHVAPEVVDTIAAWVNARSE
jgi:hypothetical protein